jgi:hypothetical protein
MERKRVFSKYADKGFRMEIDYADPLVKKYDDRHRAYKAEWIVTPAKLLYPGQAMKKLYTFEEYKKACTELEIILNEIKKDSGVDLLDEAKLRRIDVAHDIESPEEAFTKEVIRLAKKALAQTGYTLMKPVEEEKKKEEWKDENAAFYFSKSQGVSCKIYNKKEDMRIHNYDDGNLSGLLRFELALQRKFLKAQKYMLEEYLTTEELPYILGNVMLYAPVLMQKHITTPLWSGAMLSRDLQKKYIKIHCKGKKAKFEKMMAYRKEANRKTSMREVDDNLTVEGYFEEMELSPLCVSDEIKYVPAFSDLLNGTENERVKRFLSLN